MGKLIIYIISIKIFLSGGQVISQSISSTRHNLSISGPGPVTADNEQEICIFCHTPHNSLPAAPLWNRSSSGQTYILYDNTTSSTFHATAGQPDGSSILCLSCHDGTIALGNVNSRSTDITFGTTMTRGNLTTDLSNDHPVSFVFDAGLAIADPQLIHPPTSPVTLDENNKLQCTACHDPHKNTFTKFLVTTNENSDLCIKCHNMTDWSGSSHQVSGKTWTGGGSNPWAHIEIPYSTVQQNACENCHDPHNASGKTRLLKSVSSLFENNCTDCHNGNVAAQNITADIIKQYSHSGYDYSLHSPNEPISPGTPHVVCVDCHNPHGVVTGNPLNNIQGIDQNRNTVSSISNEYELCFRCHSGPNAFPLAPTPRQLGSNDLINDFEITNISKHPVLSTADGLGRTLIAPWNQPGIQVKCTDCHASNNSSAKGPHGSIYPRILKANYNLAVSTNLANHNDATLAAEFALCAQCHNMANVNNLHSGMKQGHFLAYTTCNTCHDPHGFQGGSTSRNLYLINLSTTATSPNSSGNQFIQINGDGTGNCNFTCHGKPHTHSGSQYR